MKATVVGLLLCIAILQAKLWFDSDGIKGVQALQQQIAEQNLKNQERVLANSQIEAQIIDLKRGVAAIEERAREDLGFVKQNETFYQLVFK